jgi:HD superfamily phosphodiesterase
MPQIADLFGVANSDVEMLRRAGVSEEDIAHCLKVAHKAVEIARKEQAGLSTWISFAGEPCFMT